MVHSRLFRGMSLHDALRTPYRCKKKFRHPRYVRISIDGKVYLSLAAVAKAYGLNYQMVTKRYQAGYSPHEIAHGKPEQKPKTETKHISKRLVFNGKEYKNQTELCRDYKVNYNTFHTRLSVGWPFEEALGIKPHKSRSGGARKVIHPPSLRPQTCNGKDYETIAALARAFDLRVSTVRGRIRCGWTPEQAVGLKSPPKDKKSKSIIVDGRSFRSQSDAAEFYGIAENNFRYRISVLGWTPEQAAEVHPKPGSVVVDGKRYDSYRSAAIEFGINKFLMKCRMRLGWTPEEALELVPRKKPHWGGYSETFFSKHPDEKKKAATLYFVFLNNCETGESFYKIGLTAQSVKIRFRLSRYDARALATCDTSLYEAWQWEGLLLEEYQECQYIAKDKGFAGRRECLKLTEAQVQGIVSIFREI